MLFFYKNCSSEGFSWLLVFDSDYCQFLCSCLNESAASFIGSYKCQGHQLHECHWTPSKPPLLSCSLLLKLTFHWSVFLSFKFPPLLVTTSTPICFKLLFIRTPAASSVLSCCLSVAGAQSCRLLTILQMRN